MEHLLSVSFDHLASFDGQKIKKGLRQIDGLLAQVCLSAHESAAARTSSSNNNNISKHSKKSRYSLSDLGGDAAFREFFKLQDGFEWNIATRLVQTLDKLYAKSDDGSLDLLIVSALDSLQGVLLLHPPSRVLFSRVQNMNLLLDLLEPINCPAIQSATLLVLVVALLETPANTRVFEELDGLLTVSSIFKSRSTARDVKFKTMEFLYFYLMPEAAPFSSNMNNAKGDYGGRRSPPGGNDDKTTLSTERKQRMLGEHLANVDDLVRDLQQYIPV
ncbi:cell division protein Cdc14 [Coniella lustricola]|uniref:Cell division protein Cdc14 n=1 Tax=Coniella lustricola TaxID=2025994 RepID=A0A2T3A9Q4_9PEZI|nr:cell division protein Cdc14 [Coniella lustricola]